MGGPSGLDVGVCDARSVPEFVLSAVYSLSATRSPRGMTGHAPRPLLFLDVDDDELSSCARAVEPLFDMLMKVLTRRTSAKAARAACPEALFWDDR